MHTYDAMYIHTTEVEVLIHATCKLLTFKLTSRGQGLAFRDTSHTSNVTFDPSELNLLNTKLLSK